MIRIAGRTPWTRLRRATVPALLLLSVSLAGCEDDEASPFDPQPRPILTELELHRAEWLAEGPDDYDLTLQRICFCPTEITQPVVVSVRGGFIISVTEAETGDPVDPQWRDLYPDVEGLFDLITDAVRRGAATISVEYDDELGHPLSIFIDYDEGIADEELGFEVLALTPR